MSDKVGFARTIWRKILKSYYDLEKEILFNPQKKEIFLKLLYFFPINNHKVIFNSFFGKGFGENPKYIAEELLRQKKRIKLIWIVNSNEYNFPEGIRPVNQYSLRAYYESATAKVWVYNTRSCMLTKKRNGQILLQTWHGGYPIKKIEKDAESKLSKSYVENAKEDGRVANGILVDGAFIERIYRESFWLNNNCEYLRFGVPRCDILLNADRRSIRKKVCKELNINNNTFIVLYAPTFRKDYTTEAYLSRLDIIEGALFDRFGATTIVLRLHPNMVSNRDKTFDYGSCINGSEYVDVQELVITADALITDYSSIAFDFCLIRKPVFACIKDMEKLLEDRGIYDIFDKAPFPILYNENELAYSIRHFNYLDYLKSVDYFYKAIPNYNNGMAAKKTVDWLLSKGLKG